MENIMNFLFPMWPSQQETFGTNIRLEDFKIIHRVKAFTVQWLLLTVEQREFSTDLGCVVQKPFSVEIMSKCQKSCAGKTGLLEPFSITTHHHNIFAAAGCVTVLSRGTWHGSVTPRKCDVSLEFMWLSHWVIQREQRADQGLMFKLDHTFTINCHENR